MVPVFLSFIFKASLSNYVKSGVNILRIPICRHTLHPGSNQPKDTPSEVFRLPNPPTNKAREPRSNPRD